MKRHLIEKDLKHETPVPLTTIAREGVKAGADAGDASADKAKAPGNHANAQIKSQPGSQGTIDLGKQKK